AQVVDMHGRERVIGEALEEFVHQIDVKRSDQRARERHMPLEPGPPREIDDDARERFVERNVGVAIAPNARLVAKCLLDRSAERDADILDRVMRVDVQVAVRANVEIDQAVAPDLIEHVIEKRHAGGERRMSAAVQVDVDGDRRLGGLALDVDNTRRGFGGCVHGIGFSTLNNASISAGVPTVIRRQLASSGCQPWRFLTRMLASRNRANQSLALGTRASTKLVAVGYTATPGIIASA